MSGNNLTPYISAISWGEQYWLCTRQSRLWYWYLIVHSCHVVWNDDLIWPKVGTRQSWNIQMNRVINFLTDKCLIPEVSLYKQIDCYNIIRAMWNLRVEWIKVFNSLHSKTPKYIGNFRIWAYQLKVIPETCRVH